MLHKMVEGRLGNQMFQYAMMRSYQEKNKIDDKINFNFSLLKREGKVEDGFCNQLTFFNLDYNKVVFEKKISLNFIQRILFFNYCIHHKLLKLISKKNCFEIKKQKYELKIKKKNNKYGLYLYNYGYYNFDNNCKYKNRLFFGYNESYKYFDNIKEILYKEFTPKYDKLDKNKKMYDEIEKTESVCISIRRGDFFDNAFVNDCLVCTEKYFYNAIEKIKEKVHNPKFVVFSDDIKWIKENMNFPEGTIYETGDDPIWEKLRLMYSCKHFIISNSTFSWWAQYLSRNETKIVVAPEKWRNFNITSKEIYMPNWILTKVD